MHVYAPHNTSMCKCLHTHNKRDDDESDSTSTDEDRTWGGLGVFEYGRRGLPHAIVHSIELIMTGGHHGAYCTSAAEAAHKKCIKRAARFSRTRASRNQSQDSMLSWVLRHELYDAVENLSGSVSQGGVDNTSSSEGGPDERQYRLSTSLNFSHDWQNLHHDRETLPAVWGSTFLSKHVLVTRAELLVLLRTQLGMDATRRNLTRIQKHLFLRCYGAVTLQTSQTNTRKVVGVDRFCKSRRDFVHLQGSERGTVYAAQVFSHTYTNSS